MLFLQGVQPFKFGIIIAGFAVRDPDMLVALGAPIPTPSIHFVGEKDFVKRASGQLMAHFSVHTAVWHAGGALLLVFACISGSSQLVYLLKGTALRTCFQSNTCSRVSNWSGQALRPDARLLLRPASCTALALLLFPLLCSLRTCSERMPRRELRQDAGRDCSSL